MATNFELICYGCLCLISFLLFRIRFNNPTKKNVKFPPGPMALPVVGHLHLLGPLLHQALHKLSCRYGPFIHVRVGSANCVLGSTPEIARELLKTHDSAFCNRPRNKAIDYMNFDVGPTLKTYGPVWRYIKKISVSELLGSHSVHKYYNIRTMELHHLLRQIINKSKLGETLNLTNEASRFANNIISQAIISKRLSDMSGDEDPIKLVEEVTSVLGEFNIADFIGIFKKYDIQGFKRKLADTRSRYEVVIEKIMKERELERTRQRGKIEDRSKDFLDILLDSSEDSNEANLRRDHAKALLLEYFTGGTDSMSTAIVWTMAELINNPSVMKKAREEINRVVGQNRLVDEPDTPHLPYVNAIVKEALRLHPPFPLILRSSNTESKVRDYTLPEGTTAIVNLSTIGRSPEVWKNPLEFLPERFLDGDMGGASFDLLGQNDNYLPFGSGRRSCSGMAFAMQVLPVAVAALIQCFDWLVDKEPGKDGKLVDLTEKPGFSIRPLHDIVCKPIIRFNPPNLMEL